MSDVIQMFVYGTLRPGQYNHDRFDHEDGVKVVATNATIKGRMYDFGYPLVDVTEDGTIIGDLLEVDVNSTWYYSIVRMEVGARYVPAFVEVQVNESGSIKTMALVWHMPDAKRQGRCRIKSGDFLAYDGRS